MSEEQSICNTEMQQVCRKLAKGMEPSEAE